MEVSWNVNKTEILVICLEKWTLLVVGDISYVYILIPHHIDKSQQLAFSLSE